MYKQIPIMHCSDFIEAATIETACFKTEYEDNRTGEKLKGKCYVLLEPQYDEPTDALEKIRRLYAVMGYKITTAEFDGYRQTDTSALGIYEAGKEITPPEPQPEDEEGDEQEDGDEQDEWVH